MKNLLYIAAIAATAVGFTSCSSNEDLNDAVKDSGVPFKVTASAPTTRATDVTTDNFTNFKLYAFEGSATTPWIDGKQFTKSTSWAPTITTEQYNWPTAATLSNFYGVSENATSMSSAFVDDIKTSQSFTYTLPTTIADQKDLLVASTTGKSTDAQVALAFKHALANATLTLKLDPKYSVTYGPTATAHYRLAIKIKSISICNVKTVGKYNFSTSTWSDQTTYGTYTMDYSTSPLVIDTDRDNAKTLSVNVDGNNGKLMFIPQTTSYWDITANVTNEATMAIKPTDKTYIVLSCITMAYVPSEVIAKCNDLVTATTFTKDATSGNYFLGGKEVATSDGQVIDFSNASLNASVFPSIETYNEANAPTGNFEDFDDATLFANLYKPFKINSANDSNNPNKELLANYTHKITIEMTNAIRETGTSAYGEGLNPDAAKKR